MNEAVKGHTTQVVEITRQILTAMAFHPTTVGKMCQVAAQAVCSDCQRDGGWVKPSSLAMQVVEAARQNSTAMTFSSIYGQHSHFPSIAFQNLPLNSARIGYATEGALFISAQLSTDAVSALRKQPSAQARR